MLIQAAAAAAKISLLVLLLIFDDGSSQLKLDTDSMAGPPDMAGCEAASRVEAAKTMQHRNELPGLVAVKPLCFETDDPRPDVEEFLKNHAIEPQSAPATKHVPGPGEAAFEKDNGWVVNVKV